MPRALTKGTSVSVADTGYQYHPQEGEEVPPVLAATEESGHEKV